MKKIVTNRKAPAALMEDLNEDDRKYVYTGAILRMIESGIISKSTANEMLDRVGEMS